MNERGKIKEVVINTKIYDPELPQKAVQALSGNMPELEPDERLALDIVFNKAVYQQAAFYHYELTQEHKGPAPKTDQEKARQKIYDVLGEQLDKVISALKEFGFAICDAGIIGDDLEDDAVHIELYRKKASFTGKGKRQTEIKARKIMPDRPYISKTLAEAFARIILDHMRKQNAIEFAAKNHTPNWVPAVKLFSVIPETLSAEYETDTDFTADKLISKAFMASPWPLHIRSRRREDQGDPVTGETQIDCPEYIVFQLKQGGSWELKEVDGLKSAQQAITKQGFHYKSTKAVVVLKDLEAVPYTLFAESDDGLIAVSPSEANAHKKLHVCWNKTK